MKSSNQPRAVLVTRATIYEQLLARHGTRQQAAFFLQTRQQSVEQVEAQHQQFQRAMQTVLQAIPVDWRRTRVDRGDLDRFLFEPSDIVIALGQDGLVANTAKYLDGQPVIGLNSSPDHYEGVLVPLQTNVIDQALAAVAAGRGDFEERAMVEAELEDGQKLRALNELFVGHQSHQSARYEIRWSGDAEQQSSSGLIVSTGTGSTGWARSIRRERDSQLSLPNPCEPRLAFFVREAWPSVDTGIDIAEGSLNASQQLEVVSRMNDGGVIFGDGVEDDRIEFNWGRRVRITLSESKLRLLHEL